MSSQTAERGCAVHDATLDQPQSEADDRFEESPHDAALRYQRAAKLKDKLATKAARSAWLDLVAQSPDVTDHEFRFLHVKFSFGRPSLKNCFPSIASVAARMGGPRPGRRAKKDAHRAVGKALQRAAQMDCDLAARGWQALHPEGAQAALPAGIVGDEPWTGPIDFSNRTRASRRRARRTTRKE